MRSLILLSVFVSNLAGAVLIGEGGPESKVIKDAMSESYTKKVDLEVHLEQYMSSRDFAYTYWEHKKGTKNVILHVMGDQQQLAEYQAKRTPDMIVREWETAIAVVRISAIEGEVNGHLNFYDGEAYTGGDSLQRLAELLIEILNMPSGVHTYLDENRSYSLEKVVKYSVKEIFEAVEYAHRNKNKHITQLFWTRLKEKLSDYPQVQFPHNERERLAWYKEVLGNVNIKSAVQNLQFASRMRVEAAPYRWCSNVLARFEKKQ